MVCGHRSAYGQLLVEPPTPNDGHSYGVGFNFVSITAFTFLGRLSDRRWNIDVGFDSIQPRALERLGTDVG